MDLTFFDILGNLTLQKLYWEEASYWFLPLFSIEFSGDHRACFDSDSSYPFPLDISMANWLPNASENFHFTKQDGVRELVTDKHCQ